MTLVFLSLLSRFADPNHAQLWAYKLENETLTVAAHCALTKRAIRFWRLHEPYIRGIYQVGGTRSTSIIVGLVWHSRPHSGTSAASPAPARCST